MALIKELEATQGNEIAQLNTIRKMNEEHGQKFVPGYYVPAATPAPKQPKEAKKESAEPEM